MGAPVGGPDERRQSPAAAEHEREKPAADRDRVHVGRRGLPEPAGNERPVCRGHRIVAQDAREAPEDSERDRPEGGCSVERGQQPVAAQDLGSGGAEGLHARGATRRGHAVAELVDDGLEPLLIG